MHSFPPSPTKWCEKHKGSLPLPLWLWKTLRWTEVRFLTEDNRADILESWQEAPLKVTCRRTGPQYLLVSVTGRGKRQLIGGSWWGILNLAGIGSDIFLPLLLILPADAAKALEHSVKLMLLPLLFLGSSGEE